MKCFLVLLLLTSQFAVTFVEAATLPETTILQAETEFLRAQLARLTAERDLQSAIAAPETARLVAIDEARDQRRLDTLNAVSGLSASVPAGTHTISGDGVATPKGMELIFQNLENGLKTLRNTLCNEVGGKVIIFVDTIPPTNPGLDLALYSKLMDDLLTDAAIATGGTAMPEGVGTAAIITALPGILKAVSGFFRADHTEKVSASGVNSGTAISSLIPKLLAGKDGAGKEGVPTGIYLNLESFAFANMDKLDDISIVDKIKRVKTADAILAEMTDKLDLTPLEKAVAAAAAALEDVTTARKNLEFQRDLLVELAKVSPQQAQAYESKIKDLGDQILSIQADIRAKKQGLDTAKTTLAKAGEPRQKMTAVRERIAKLMTALSSTDGSPPLFVRLIRDQRLVDLKKSKNTVRFLTLNVAASPNSTITRKTFFSQKMFGSSFLALEYRIADETSKLVTAGVFTLPVSLERIRLEN